ncbi:MAG: hypothetical protein GWN01_09695, partial [Nitrosopumilaceae archaeon]|nr:hypothetical protein [Nitrosopumilaceae archaeon]NIU85798.1 hypothetical protein [Nitrosopumilaceae archaeon]NIV66035.1 hypothetical protein [Nitrosopumilaceae archaeon]NIX61780.1 hypothetical protein [Nitrosopumilaceae archaeon]
MKTTAVLMVGVLALILVLPSNVSADLLPPKKQLSLGFSNDEVVCDELVKIIKTSTGNASCVEPNTA